MVTSMCLYFRKFQIAVVISGVKRVEMEEIGGCCFQMSLVGHAMESRQNKLQAEVLLWCFLVVVSRVDVLEFLSLFSTHSRPTCRHVIVFVGTMIEGEFDEL